MPPAYVKPYVERQKNDMADAEAICEAVTRANMRFVPTKTPEQPNASPYPPSVLATALVACVADPSTFRSSRNFSAWIGLVPKQHSSGGKDRFGSISKQGDRYLRSLFVAGALAVIRYAKIHGTRHRPWLTALLARKPTKVAAIALANKIARMAWAMMAKGERYKEPIALVR
jgi:transposase